MKHFLVLSFLILNSVQILASEKEPFTVIREDFTGDGIRDIAIFEQPNGRVATWKLYVSLQDGTYSYAYHVDFHPLAFRIYNSIRGSELVTFHAAGAGKGSLITYKLSDISSEQIDTLEIESSDSATGSHKDLYNRYFAYLRTDPRTQKIPHSKVIIDGESLKIDFD